MSLKLPTEVAVLWTMRGPVHLPATVICLSCADYKFTPALWRGGKKTKKENSAGLFCADELASNKCPLTEEA